MSDEANPPEGSTDTADPLPATGRIAGPRRARVIALLERTPVSPMRIIAAVLVALVALGGAWWLLRPPAAPVEASLPMARPTTAPADAAASGSDTVPASGAVGDPSGSEPMEVAAHAAGAVARPGLYRLEPGSRVADLLAAAGGAAPEADNDRLNLAALLIDGQRIYVPEVGEDPVPTVVAGDDPPPTTGLSSSGTAPPEEIDLNRANLQELDTLPGVGPTTAQAILDYRNEHGSFASIEELLEVRGIGETKLAELRDRVRV